MSPKSVQLLDQLVKFLDINKLIFGSRIPIKMNEAPNKIPIFPKNLKKIVGHLEIGGHFEFSGKTGDVVPKYSLSYPKS